MKLISPTYLPLVPACRAHGVGKTLAFELVAAGLLETFKLGRRRYVVLESLRTLPDRLRQHAVEGVSRR